MADEVKQNNTTSSAYKKPGGKPFINILLVLFASLCCFFCVAAIAGSNLVQEQLFPQGTIVDGVDIGGKSLAEGRNMVQQKKEADTADFSIRFSYEGQDIVLSKADFPSLYNIDETLENLYYQNSDGQQSLLAGLNAVFSPKVPDRYATSWDRSAIMAVLSNAFSNYDIPAMDAKATYDKKKNVFSFTPDIPGKKADVEQATDDMIAILSGEKEGPVSLSVLSVDAAISLAQCKADTQLLGEMKTALGKDAARIQNIRQLADALNGTAISVGETLSLKGFLQGTQNLISAPIYADGGEGEVVGGGIAQISTSLYQLAANANLEIPTRKAHPYISSYAAVGMDAALSLEGEEDLIIQNTSNAPIWVVCTFDKNSLSLKLYGRPLAQGTRVELVPEIQKEFAPEGRQVELTASLPQGREKALLPAQNGYEIKIIRKYYEGDTLVKEEILSQDSYGARGPLIQVGTGGKTK
ncbi:VanW family protein [Eubacteriales bacterium OttesenSCG-928-M02]|nr:VanW family protein [Eubacteriales bacterium OttesenSCG-928-M02]